MSDRTKRLQELLQKNREKQKPYYGELYKECIDALGNGTEELSSEKSESIYTMLSKSYPFTSWDRIDWSKVKKKYTIDSLEQISQFVSLSSKVYILWNTGPFPVLYTKLGQVLSNIDDVTAVGSDTYLLYPGNFVIEFHHENEIIISFINDCQ